MTPGHSKGHTGFAWSCIGHKTFARDDERSREPYGLDFSRQRQCSLAGWEKEMKIAVVDSVMPSASIKWHGQGTVYHGRSKL